MRSPGAAAAALTGETVVGAARAAGKGEQSPWVAGTRGTPPARYPGAEAAPGPGRHRRPPHPPHRPELPAGPGSAAGPTCTAPGPAHPAPRNPHGDSAPARAQPPPPAIQVPGRAGAGRAASAAGPPMRQRRMRSANTEATRPRFPRPGQRYLPRVRDGQRCPPRPACPGSSSRPPLLPSGC